VTPDAVAVAFGVLGAAFGVLGAAGAFDGAAVALGALGEVVLAGLGAATFFVVLG
jgi:hypothetical protein